MKKLLSFHNDFSIKQKYLDRLLAHAKADEIIKGKYWQNGKGCAVGCTVHSSSHAAYEKELGIPRLIARLEDGIFEALPNHEAKLFPVKFLESIPVGVDLSLVFYKFMYWLLVDPVDGVLKFAKTDQSKESIVKVGIVFERKINGENINLKEWTAYAAYAADAAYAAAYAAYAADAAADAAAYAADAAAADAAAYAADAAAYAADAAYAAAAAAAADAKQKARSKQAEKLIQLLSESKND